MSNSSTGALSVGALFAEREARRRKDKEDAEQFQRRQNEELEAFKKRLDEFVLTDDVIEAQLNRVRRAFERGETEVMLTSFPAAFCTDQGRAINNAGLPPINPPSGAEALARSDEPEWLATLPKGARPVYQYWKEHLKPGGFSFSARIISYPGGMPGDVGLFFSWPKASADLE